MFDLERRLEYDKFYNKNSAYFLISSVLYPFLNIYLLFSEVMNCSTLSSDCYAALYDSFFYILEISRFFGLELGCHKN
jgi:hypothetical protein